MTTSGRNCSASRRASRPFSASRQVPKPLASKYFFSEVRSGPKSSAMSSFAIFLSVPLRRRVELTKFGTSNALSSAQRARFGGLMGDGDDVDLIGGFELRLPAGGRPGGSGTAGP